MTTASRWSTSSAKPSPHWSIHERLLRFDGAMDSRFRGEESDRPMRTVETASRESSLAPLPFPAAWPPAGGCPDSTNDDLMTDDSALGRKRRLRTERVRVHPSCSPCAFACTPPRCHLNRGAPPRLQRCRP